jgi:ABC-type Fe3+ transport system substrate-binding protein
MNRGQGGRSRREFLYGAALAGSAALLGCAGTEAPEDDAELYRKARGEGGLNLYGGGPMAAFQNWSRQFEAAYPGIKVEIASGFSNELSPRIDKQIAAGAVEADLAILQTLQDFDRWHRQGELLRFRPAALDVIPDAFRDPAGTSFPTGVVGVAYAHNPDLIARDKVPRIATDFLDPSLSGKVISTYPHDDDLTLFLYDAIVRAYGWGWVDRLMANKPRFIRGHLGVAREIAAGRAVVSFDATFSQSAAMSAQGAKIIVTVPDDPMPIFTQAVGVMRRAPHPNAAKLFVNWLLGKEQQSKLGPGRWSPRRDVPPPAGLKPITDYKILTGFREFVVDEPHLQQLRREFEAKIGPVVGDPVL